jgi:hypothetical protein
MAAQGLFPAGRNVVQRLGLGRPGLVGSPFVFERAAREISCTSALRRRSLRPLSDTTVGCCIRSFSGSRPGSSAPSDRRRIQRWPPPQFSMDLLGSRGGNRRRPRHHGRHRSRGFADISLLVSSLCLCIFKNFPNWLSALYCGVRIPSSSIP